MMGTMYRCDLCSADFDCPAALRWSEPRPDGFRERFCQAVCPVCGAEEQYFEEMTEGEDEPWENPLRRHMS